MEHQSEHHGNNGPYSDLHIKFTKSELSSVLDESLFKCSQRDGEVRVWRIGLSVPEPVILEICETQAAVVAEECREGIHETVDEVEAGHGLGVRDPRRPQLYMFGKESLIPVDDGGLEEPKFV